MEFWYLYIIIFLCIWLPILQNKRRRRRRKVIDRRINERRVRKMSVELIKKFMGKKCIFQVDGGSIPMPTGILRTIEENWAELETDKGEMQLVNLDYVSKIEEYPQKKKKK